MVLQYGASFASDVLAPTNASSDVVGCRWEEGRVTLPEVYASLWKIVQEQGWISTVAPLEMGGQGLPKVLGTALDEMITAGNPAFQTLVGLCRASANLLMHHGSQELKDTYVPKLLSGEWQGTMCLTEAGAGSDVGASRTRAQPVGPWPKRCQATSDSWSVSQ